MSYSRPTGYDRLLRSTTAPARETMVPNTLVALYEHNQLTVYWIENGKLINQSFSKNTVQSIIEQLPVTGEVTNNEKIIKDIILQYGCPALEDKQISLNQQMQLLNTLAYRGDTREPQIIFEEGFQRRGGSWEFYNDPKNILEKKIQEPAFRISQGGQLFNDIIRTSAVCFTRNFDCAPIFPVNDFSKSPPSQLPPPHIFIYIVNVQQGYSTYLLQQELGSPLAFCEEIATRDVPSGDVIAAVKCQRFFNIDAFGKPDWKNGVRYQLTSEILWNPKLKNEVQVSKNKLERNKEIENLIALKKGKYVECPIPKNMATAAPDLIDSELFKNVLTRTPDMDKLTVLLSNSTNPDLVNAQMDLTPLMVSTLFNQIEVFNLFIAYNADPNVSQKNGATALFIAVKQHGDLSFIKSMLLHNNIDVTRTCMMSREGLIELFKNSSPEAQNNVLTFIQSKQVTNQPDISITAAEFAFLNNRPDIGNHINQVEKNNLQFIKHQIIAVISGYADQSAAGITMAQRLALNAFKNEILKPKNCDKNVEQIFDQWKKQNKNQYEELLQPQSLSNLSLFSQKDHSPLKFLQNIVATFGTNKPDDSSHPDKELSLQ